MRKCAPCINNTKLENPGPALPRYLRLLFICVLLFYLRFTILFAFYFSICISLLTLLLLFLLFLNLCFIFFACVFFFICVWPFWATVRQTLSVRRTFSFNLLSNTEPHSLKSVFTLSLSDLKILLVDFDNEVFERKVDTKWKVRLSAKLIGNAWKKSRDCPAWSPSSGSKNNLTCR